jgi:hypothetical protein
MPRANRYFVPGFAYHLTHRCHNRQFLMRFAEDRNLLYPGVTRINLLYPGVTRISVCMAASFIKYVVVFAP